MQVPYWSFTVAVIVAAWVGGRGPSLTAAALSALAAKWLFVAPTLSFAIADPAAAWGLGLFVITIIPIGLMIVSLREALLALAMAEEVLRRQGQLVNHSHDAIITLDPDRHILTWNKGAEELYGWPEQDAAGKMFHQLAHTVCTTSLAVVAETLRRCGRWEGEMSQITRDGRRVLVDSRQVILKSFGTLPACILTINRDITERKQTLEALRESEARLQFVLDAANLGAWELDLAHNTKWRSAHYDEILGYSAPTYQKFLERVLPEDRQELDRKFHEAAATGTDWQYEFRVCRADGAVRWIWTRGKSLSLGGPMYGVKQDITERKEAEEHLRYAQKLESIGLLAGGIAHDFNNLLTVVMGNAECEHMERPDSKNIQQILDASERAAHLTRQLLAYAGKGQFLVKKTFDLVDLVSRSMQRPSSSVPKRVSLEFNQPADELLIEADPSQIEQIVMNMVINAGEAIPPDSDGRIKVSVSLCDVTPEMIPHHGEGFDAKPGRFVCLEVVDNGSGMDESTLKPLAACVEGSLTEAFEFPLAGSRRITPKGDNPLQWLSR